jgi:hypothetical protein
MRQHLVRIAMFSGLAFVTLALVPSCDWLPQNRSLSESVQKLQEQNKSLSIRVAALEKLASDLVARLGYLEQASHTTVELDPTARDFRRLDTSMGMLAVAIRDVQPGGDGVRVLLTIGNLTSATLGKVQIKAKWGKRKPTDKTRSSYERETKLFLDSLKEKTINLHDDLIAGHWNKVSLTLPGTSPEKFGFLEISIDSAAIALMAPGS